VKKSLAPYSSLALAAALLLAAAGAAFSLDVYPSVAGDYSVNFTSTPKEEVRTTPTYRIVSHAINVDNVIYIVAHGDFQVPPPPELELLVVLELLPHAATASDSTAAPRKAPAFLLITASPLTGC